MPSPSAAVSAIRSIITCARTVTFDYLSKSKFEGSTKGSGADFGACVGPCTSRDIANMRAYSLLANAYVDLGTYGYFTP